MTTTNHQGANTMDHCTNCGSTNHEDLATGDGYSACCNDRICGSTGTYRFGTPEKYADACCWAKAEEAGITEGSRFA